MRDRGTYRRVIVLVFSKSRKYLSVKNYWSYKQINAILKINRRRAFSGTRIHNLEDSPINNVIDIEIQYNKWK